MEDIVLRITNILNLRIVRAGIGALVVLTVCGIYLQHRAVLRSLSRMPFTDVTPGEPNLYVPMSERGRWNGSVGNDTWIVVTSVSANYFHIEKLAALGCKVVVVGDLKTPKNWKFPGCTFLGVEDQRKLGYKTVEHVPYNSYTRKNIGYLYAIENGARFIYDTDDDNHPASLSGEAETLKFRHSQFSLGLVYDTGPNMTVVNPYAHFGQESMWPRGYPLDSVGQPRGKEYLICGSRTPAVQQGLVNGDPDVDAIFRLTRKSFLEDLNISFDSRAPHVTVPRGIYAPYNSQNTFHTYEALWALVLPASVAFRVTDIWRGYWAQTLLWLIGQHVAFFPPNAVQVRNSHNYLNDFKEEDQVYKDTGRLISFLRSWNCSLPGFFDCAIDLAAKMAADRFWNESDHLLIQSWIEDLKTLGYPEPKIIRYDAKLPCVGEHHAVTFSPVPQLTSYNAERQIEVSPSGWRYLQEFCTRQVNWKYISRDLEPSIILDNILLIVVFNFPHYGNIPILDAVYRQHFPNIAYCGNIQDGWGTFNSALNSDHVTFINVTYTRGFFSYDCLLRAIEMDYHVDGYLTVGDDLLFNFWNLKSFNANGVYLQDTDYRAIDRRAKSSGWSWWVSEVLGRGALNRALDDIDKMVSGDGDNGTYVAKVLGNVTANRAAKGENIVAVGAIDLYYVPSKMADEIYYTLVMFRRQQVFVEIAIPTALSSCGINVSFFTGTSVRNGSRVYGSMDYYKRDEHFLHPVKLGVVVENERIKEDYCTKYVKDAIENW